MPWNTITPFLVWAVIFIPVFFVLMIVPPRVKLTAGVIWLAYLAASLYFIFTVNWALVNYWLRVLPLVLSLILVVRFWRANRAFFDFATNQVRDTPRLPGKSARRVAVLVLAVLVLLLFIPLDLLALRTTGYKSYAGKPALLFYPLRYGMYVVANGGNGLDGLGMNDSYQTWMGQKNPSDHYMAYAVDLMKLRNDRGWVSQGILPSESQAYEGYGDWVYAPCVGVVAYVEDGHPDQTLGTAEAPLGNRVVLKCYEFYVTVANLRYDSILVKTGEPVSFLQQIGLVGSSGAPSIPHIRVFTTLGSWDEKGTPVPQLFDTGFRFLSRNDLMLPGY